MILNSNETLGESEIEGLKNAMRKKAWADRYYSENPGLNEFLVLNFLSENQDQDCFAKDIAEKLNVSSAAISQVIKGLVKKKAIEVKPWNYDRRYQVLKTNKESEVFMKKFAQEYKQKEEKEMIEADKEWLGDLQEGHWFGSNGDHKPLEGMNPGYRENCVKKLNRMRESFEKFPGNEEYLEIIDSKIDEFRAIEEKEEQE